MCRLSHGSTIRIDLCTMHNDVIVYVRDIAKLLDIIHFFQDFNSTARLLKPKLSVHSQLRSTSPMFTLRLLIMHWMQTVCIGASGKQISITPTLHVCATHPVKIHTSAESASIPSSRVIEFETWMPEFTTHMSSCYMWDVLSSLLISQGAVINGDTIVPHYEFPTQKKTRYQTAKYSVYSHTYNTYVLAAALSHNSQHFPLMVLMLSCLC